MPVSIQRAGRSAADVIAVPTTDGQVVTGACVLYGGTLCNNSGTKQEIHVHNGTSASGVHVMGLAASANDSQNVTYTNGVSCPNGIFVNVISGTPTGAIFYSMA
jgi:hypothetical protein